MMHSWMQEQAKGDHSMFDAVVTRLPQEIEREYKLQVSELVVFVMPIFNATVSASGVKLQRISLVATRQRT